ncbi:centromere protein S isoform X1 [Peromyscus californicus insignis]|uniref:centromere protein S isoform X1 n=1 Tax=Peromyscus californicus insignis TaxID=564181 RepID=UPI0022A7DA66|nr:centromere protein S isoform X1 [Peromyscus californicus insignis]
MEEEEVEAEEEQQFSHRQIRGLLLAAPEGLDFPAEAKGCSSLHGRLSLRGSCVGQTGAVQQADHCGDLGEHFAKDLEMFARHAKRSTVTTEDVKLLARRSNSLLKYITEKNEEIAQLNLERKAKKKRKPEDENRNSREPDAEVVSSES